MAAPALDFCPDVQGVIHQSAHFGNEKNPKNNSVVIRLQCKDCSVLFVGDAEDGEEQLLLSDATTIARLPSTYLKAPHRGCDTSSSQDFLNQIHSQVVAVSCGEKETGTNVGYKHPRKSTIDGSWRWQRPGKG